MIKLRLAGIDKYNLAVGIEHLGPKVNMLLQDISFRKVVAVHFVGRDEEKELVSWHNPSSLHVLCQYLH